MNFYHPGSMGDIIYALPTIIKLGGGSLFLLRHHHFDIMHRLLELQPCLDKVTEHNKKKEFGKFHLDIDFDNRDVWSNFKMQQLSKCYADFCGIEVNTEEPWLFNIKPKHKTKIIVHRTYRYHDRSGTDWSDKQIVDWKILKDYKDDVLFVGWDREFIKFEETAGFTPKRFICRDSLGFAQIIKGSKLFVGNQSLGFALAEAMKHPRALEVYRARNNCQPNGEHGHTKISHEMIERYLNKNETS